MGLPVGKVPNQMLERLLGRIKIADPRVIIGPGVGVDAAVIRFGEGLLVAKTDPITFAIDLIGWYAVNINANDIAAMGASPHWFLATVLLPEGIEESQITDIFAQIQRGCDALGVTLVGGHTEVTYNLDRPIIVGCMLGETTQERLVSSAGAQPGDDIVLTKGIAVEGTAVLAREAAEELIGTGIPTEVVDRARGYLFDPGISIVREARLACNAVEVHAMHDPTEGGLATGLREIAVAAGVGLLIEEEQIPILPETAVICRQLGLNPLGLLASGSLIISVPARQTARLLEELQRIGISAATIGKVVPAEDGLKMRTAEGEVIDLPDFPRDELARYLAE